jgi:hypothetical protein
LSSSEYEFIVSVYDKLDEQIDRANESIRLDVDRISILDSLAFAVYGSMARSVIECFPTVEFQAESAIEWRPDEVLSVNRNLLITAAPGYGKTSFCRNHFLRDLKMFKARDCGILPLYFAAHSLKIEEGQNFEKVFVRPEVRARLDRDPKLSVRVYLDGLDEIKSKELRDRVLDIALSLYRDNQGPCRRLCNKLASPCHYQSDVACQPARTDNGLAGWKCGIDFCILFRIE